MPCCPRITHDNIRTFALLDILMLLLIVLAVLAPAGYAALCRDL